MTLNTYNYKFIEKKWHQYWNKNNFFNPKTNKKKKSYTILMPPPNITGVLHMGHVLNNTIQDILIRKKRMKNYETCWIPGIDHASIATETKIVKILKNASINKNKISKKKFLKYIWKYKNKYGNIILNQLKRIGISCDWSKKKFTMDNILSKTVTKSFIKLYQNKYIYRGEKIINWDTKNQTVISEDEVIYKKKKSKLYYIKYYIENSINYIIISTTRPETIFGDTAICINSKDTRYYYLKNKKIIIPIIKKKIPIIINNYVNINFGTGCLKITPAHDIYDYKIGKKYNLKILNIFNNIGSFNLNTKIYTKKNRFNVRKKIIIYLDKIGYLFKKKIYVNNIGFSERTNTIIEPKISIQWFVKMKQISKLALVNVLNNNIKFYPKKFKNLYKSWINNIQDWCISRQLSWGHQIPIYYLNKEKIIAENKTEAFFKFRKNINIKKENIKQDSNILDTWFSAWLWPISVFNGINKPVNTEINYYYPTKSLITAPEIIFFWVSKMIIAGYYFLKKLPFKNIYFTGIVKDKIGKKMSKSLGNSPDIIKLIKKYSADGIRFGILFSAPAGNNLLFNQKLCNQGKIFINKIWNIFLLIKKWDKKNKSNEINNETIINWFNEELNFTLYNINIYYRKFKISNILIYIYKLIKNTFCINYLEIIKPSSNKKISLNTYKNTITFFEKLVKITHPFMPFVTEEIWHNLKKRNKKNSITISNWPKYKQYNKNVIYEGKLFFQLYLKVKKVKLEASIPKDKKIILYINKIIPKWLKKFKHYFKKNNIKKIKKINYKLKNNINFNVKENLFFISKKTKFSIEKIKVKKKILYLKKFLFLTIKKLKNKKFIEKVQKKILIKENKKKKKKNKKKKKKKKKI